MPEADKIKHNLFLIPYENSNKQKETMVKILKEEPKLFEVPKD
jgi:hypothetical protein